MSQSLFISLFEWCHICMKTCICRMSSRASAFGFAPMKNLTALHRQCQRASFMLLLTLCLCFGCRQLNSLSGTGAGRVLWRNVAFSDVRRLCIQPVGSLTRGREHAMLISAPGEPESLGGSTGMVWKNDRCRDRRNCRRDRNGVISKSPPPPCYNKTSFRPLI